MNEDRLYGVLSSVNNNDRNIILDAVQSLTDTGLSYRRSINLYFNQRLILLKAPIDIRQHLIQDGSDDEWCARFVTYILPALTRVRSRRRE